MSVCIDKIKCMYSIMVGWWKNHCFSHFSHQKFSHQQRRTNNNKSLFYYVICTYACVCPTGILHSINLGMSACVLYVFRLYGRNVSAKFGENVLRHLLFLTPSCSLLSFAVQHFKMYLQKCTIKKHFFLHVFISSNWLVFCVCVCCAAPMRCRVCALCLILLLCVMCIL